jgi:RimJ/RimL family protein N-acetyltransferase
MVALRGLGAGDESELEGFLAAHADSAMFLRSNLRTAGIVYRGAPLEGLYLAAIASGRIAGVAAHCWNGAMLLQAGIHVEALVVALAERSQRPVTGLLGPLDEVRRARTALAMTATPSQLESDEGLYALGLSDLVLPGGLRDGNLTCRAPRAHELPLLVEWRYAYSREALNGAPGDALREQCRMEIEALGHDRQFVLLAGAGIVAYSAFNAALPDIVQIGGVWTPPELRGRGYGRGVVAASLLAARDGGAKRAVLFTDDANFAARRAYAALGFRRVGDWGVVLFPVAGTRAI